MATLRRVFLTTSLAVVALAAQSPSWEPLSALDGSLLFVCGKGQPGTAELYFKDDAHAVRQLTVTQPSAGANSATWLGDRILAVIDRDLTNRMEVRELGTPPDEVGRPLGPGAAPAVSRTGTIAYLRAGEDRRGRLVDEVVRLRGGRRKVLARRHAFWDLFWVGRRLYAFTESRSGRSALLEVTRGARRSVPLRGRRVATVAVSSRRCVAYTFRRDRLAVMRLDGSRRRVFRRAWAVLAWSPDGRRVLVTHRTRIGLLNPRTGRVRGLGRLPCGYIGSAVWTRPGTHP